MKYYNEARSENVIKRKAMFLTFAISFILVSAAFFIFTESGRDVLPSQLKEWFQDDTPTPLKSIEEKA